MNRYLKFFWRAEFVLALILIVGFAVRVYKIDNPIADWHSWRQADTAAVARNFYQEGFNPLLPKFDDMSAGANGLDNPQRYRFVEFPIYNSIVYFAYLLNEGVDEKLARLISVFMSLGSIIFLYAIVAYNWNKLSALLSAFLFAVLPFNIYFSRVILPEPTLVFFCLGMFYFVNRWILENSSKLLMISIFFTAGAFLIKPMAIFYLIPLIYTYYQKEKRLWPIPKRYYYFLFFSFAPFLFWRLWIMQHPEGIPASSWLFNGDGIRFKPAFWKWILGDRLGREILTIAGSILFFLGILVKPLISEGKLLHLLVLSSVGFLLVFATGNVRHDYYQTLIVPALVIFTARGFLLLVKGTNNIFIPRVFTIPTAFLFIFLTIYLGWSEVSGLYQINNPVIIEAGRSADKILPKDAKVIAPYNGDTAFLYQINRAGWPYVPYAVSDIVKSFGATHYVSVNYDVKTKWLMERYLVIESNPKFVILDLRHANPQYIDNAEREPY